jgi:steroid delta-isomerase-like uncharacterized protein
MSVEENKAIVRRFYEEVVNKGDFTVIDELITEDFYDHSGSGSNQGLQAFKQFATMLTSAFPDLHVTLEDMIAEQDKVAARVTVRGTHKGILFDSVPPTGRAVTFTGVDIIRVRDGRIAERWNQRDLLGLMRQLGVIATD